MRPLRADIAPRVLTPGEIAALPSDRAARDAAVLLAFSAKEAIYKALDPWVSRFVAFAEAALTRAPDGTLAARLTLARGEGPFSVEVHDARGAGEEGLVVVAARVRAAEVARSSELWSAEDSILAKDGVRNARTRRTMTARQCWPAFARRARPWAHR